MSGIAGIAGEVTQDLAVASHMMMDRLQHRGPHGNGWLTYSKTGICTGEGKPPIEATEVILLHRKLSILNLPETGREPMTSSNGRYHIIYDGQIYNYIELRSELQNAGFTFRTETDTEVLLAAFGHWGLRCLRRLVGMFAFAILDSKARKLFLARDFFGIKPLYYSETSSRLAFASEIKALIELPDISREVNPQALYHYIGAGLTDYNEDTLYQGVRHLPPANYLVADLDKGRSLQPVSYWKATSRDPDDLSFDEAAMRVRELFLESVTLQTRSLGTVGVALSGGLDSSAIASSIDHVRNPSQQLHMLSYITDDSVTSDEAWIDLASSASSATLHKVRSTPENIAADIDSFITALDEPTGGPSIYSHYLVSQRARHVGVNVLFDGHGADELFEGTNYFLVTKFLSLCGHLRILDALRLYKNASNQTNLAKSIRRIGTRALPPRLQTIFRRKNNLLNLAWFEQRNVTTWMPAWAASNAYTERGPSTLLPMQLRYSDRNAMAFGIENRVPFLTPKIVEFVLRLPEDFFINSEGIRKHILRAALRGIVPDAILDRKEKIGFQRPHRSSMIGLRSCVERILSGDMARQIGPLNFKEVQRHWSEVLAETRNFDYSAWRWINLLRWAELTNVRFD